MRKEILIFVSRKEIKESTGSGLKRGLWYIVYIAREHQSVLKPEMRRQR